jgi:inosine/xanthosine triphosphate pyrophosphatase family protein
MHLLFATRNAWKTRLFTPIFRAYGFEVLTLNDLPPNNPPLPENGATAIENALSKARHYHSAAYPWVFGDDAGLEVMALNGEPGVQARRWNGIFPDDVEDQLWLDYLLDRMKDIPPRKRRAAFVAGWVLLDPAGDAHTRQVRAPFEIATHPIRPISPGSPITAVRLGPPDDLARRQAEIRTEWERWGILRELLGNKVAG